MSQPGWRSLTLHTAIVGLVAAGCSSGSENPPPATANTAKSEEPKSAPPAAAKETAPAAPSKPEQALTEMTDALQTGVESVLKGAKSREEAALALTQLLPGSRRGQELVTAILQKYEISPDELQKFLDSNAAARNRFEERLAAISRLAGSSRNLPALSDTPEGCGELLQMVVIAKHADEQAAAVVPPLVAPCKGKVPDQALSCSLTESSPDAFAACASAAPAPAGKGATPAKSSTKPAATGKRP